MTGRFRGRGFSKEKPLPRTPTQETVWGNSGEEAASLREAPPPQTPSPEERLAFGLVVSAELVPPASWARFLAGKLWSRRLTEPPRPASYRPRRGRRFPKGDRKALWSCPQARNLLCVYRRGPTPHGRGGSVSRRDHSQACRRRAQLAWARKSEGSVKLIPSRSSGEGVWGRGASLREAASPPESP